jgi:hypothetical protein
MTIANALAVLENAVNAADARTDEVLAALDFLEHRATVKWPRSVPQCVLE